MIMFLLWLVVGGVIGLFLAKVIIAIISIVFEIIGWILSFFFD